MPVIEHSQEFMVLAECMSFSVASRTLNVSQPTLSRHIGELEAALGFRLLERNPMGFTEAGRRYLEAISSIIGQLDEAVREGCAIEQGKDQALSVFMLPSRSDYARVVYESAARMKEEYPTFSLRPEYDNRRLGIAEAVETGVADVGVVCSEPVDVPEGFACEKLMDLPICAWVHKSSPILQAIKPRFEDLARAYLVRSTNRQSHAWHDATVKAFKEHGLEPKTHLKDLDDVSLFYLHLAPDEVLLDADMGNDVNEYNSKLVKIPFDNPRVMFSTYLYYNAAKAGTLTRDFVKACHEAAASL